jgi:PIN domain nuclease of toxin-antitoxin system
MLWWMREDRRLSDRAVDLIRNGRNELLWSLASSWEIAIKISVGKLDLGRPVHRFFADLVSGQGLKILDCGHDHCARVAELPLHHRDPFDRMLVAQAQIEQVPILTADPKLAKYDIETLS